MKKRISYIINSRKAFKLFLYNSKAGSKQYLLSLLIIIIVSGICFLFSSFIGPEVVAFILMLSLSFIAMVFDIFPVLLSAFLSALIWDYFFLQPRFNLRIGDTEDKIMLSMYFVIASVNGALTFKLRKMEKLAFEKKEKEKAIKLYNTLFNSLSHEFRTPIATIIGATDILLASPSFLSDTEKDKMLTVISSASIRLNQQVENLLNMSRLDSGFLQLHKDWCEIEDIINNVLTLLNDSLKDHTIKVVTADNIPLFKLDYRLIEQVIYNLLKNAIQYSRPGTIIIKISCYQEQLCMEISDNGPGFPPDEIEKVFEKFYRLKNTGTNGTGLGLSIVKGFTEAHNGTVELKNNREGGATFFIRLPAETFYVEQVTV